MKALNRLFIKKSIKKTASQISHTHGLDRALGPLQLITIGIGAIIGAGIFVMTGTAAAEFAGPGVIFSFLLALIPCFFAALCYAEFSSLIPSAGTAYSYTYHTLGEFMAWIIGWCLTLEYLFTSATVGVSWSNYLSNFLADLGLSLPAKIASSPFTYSVHEGWQSTEAIFNLPAAFIMGFIGVLIAFGIRLAAVVNDVLVFIKMAIILLFVVVGFFFVNPENWTPMIPENSGVFGEFGWSGLIRGAGVVFFAYVGFDAVSSLGQETKNPQKNLPIGMLGSLFISAFAFILVAAVTTGIIPFTQLNVGDPIAVAVNHFTGAFSWIKWVIKPGIIIGLTSVILVMLIGQTRIIYSMANDGLLPRALGKINPKTRTPMIGSLVIAFFGVLLAGIFPVGILGSLVSIGTLLAFSIVCFAVVVLRHKMPHICRPFKVPFVPFVPFIGGFACILQMCFLPLMTWIELTIWMTIGLLIYFMYGFHNSRLRKEIHDSHVHPRRKK